MVVEKIKGEKGEFWCNFANVGKLSVTRIARIRQWMTNQPQGFSGFGNISKKPHSSQNGAEEGG